MILWVYVVISSVINVPRFSENVDRTRTGILNFFAVITALGCITLAPCSARLYISSYDTDDI